jgi:hypothetical protein
MDGDIKVGKVSMTTLIEEDIVRFDISVGMAEEGIKVSDQEERGWREQYGPMHDVLLVQETKSRRELGHVKLNGVL